MRFIFSGIFFGFVLVKSEVISWFRIQEMFLFDSIHMYGVFATAILTGFIAIQLIKRFELNDLSGNQIEITEKDNSVSFRYVAGGLIFGLGWACTGACPGPLYALIGAGYPIYFIPLFGAMVGAALYGRFQAKLKH